MYVFKPQLRDSVCRSRALKLQQEVCNSALVVTYLLLAQEIRSAIGKRLGLSQVFPRHMHKSRTYTGLPGMCQSILKLPMDISCLFFLLSPLTTHLLAPFGVTASGSCHVKQLPLIILDRCPGHKAVCVQQALSQVK